MQDVRWDMLFCQVPLAAAALRSVLSMAWSGGQRRHVLPNEAEAKSCGHGQAGIVDTAECLGQQSGLLQVGRACSDTDLSAVQ